MALVDKIEVVLHGFDVGCVVFVVRLVGYFNLVCFSSMETRETRIIETFFLCLLHHSKTFLLA